MSAFQSDITDEYKNTFLKREFIKVIEKATKRCLQQTYYHTNYGTNKGSKVLRSPRISGGLLTGSNYLVEL